MHLHLEEWGVLWLFQLFQFFLIFLVLFQILQLELMSRQLRVLLGELNWRFLERRIRGLKAKRAKEKVLAPCRSILVNLFATFVASKIPFTLVNGKVNSEVSINFEGLLATRMRARKSGHSKVSLSAVSLKLKESATILDTFRFGAVEVRHSLVLISFTLL